MSGLIAEQFGWRAVYALAAGSIGLIGVAAWRIATVRTNHVTGLRRGCSAPCSDSGRNIRPCAARLFPGLLSVAFSAFWSTLAVMLHASFGLGSAAAERLALQEPLVRLPRLWPAIGRSPRTRARDTPRCGPDHRILRGPRVGRCGATASPVGLIVVAAIGFDFGIQATTVAQTIVYGIDPPARSRLNAVLFTGVFVGMATGAGLGSLALGQWGWNGVVVLATLASSGALAARLARRTAP